MFSVDIHLVSSAVPSVSRAFQMQTHPSSSASSSPLRRGRANLRNDSVTFPFLAWSLFGMTLTTYHKIWLNRSKGHFYRSKGQNCGLFALYTIFSNNWSVIFLYFGMKLPQDGDNELGREGFDWITLKVIAKVRKVRFGSLSHIYLYYQ